MNSNTQGNYSRSPALEVNGSPVGMVAEVIPQLESHSLVTARTPDNGGQGYHDSENDFQLCTQSLGTTASIVKLGEVPR